ncbi:MAG: lipopolysaccharide biosynthesis protein [Micromonosporaceae bacterium]
MTVAGTDAETIGQQAGRGLRWSLLGNVITKIGSFGMGLVLARLLTPDDFGTYAVALAATQFVMHVNDVGLIAATVQWRGRLSEMAATATTLAVGCSILIYVGFWFAAPVLAHVAQVPDATPVIRLLTMVIIIDGITAVRTGALMREFRQDKLITANLVGLVVSAAVSISLAAAGAGAMSFACGQVAAAVVIGVMVMAAARMPFQLGLDRRVVRRLMRFGLPLAASLGIEAILMNADYIIIGHLVGVTLLGFYLLAFNISNWALSVISSAVRYVSVAGFSRLSEVDKEVLNQGVHRSVPLLVTGLAPIAVLTAALSDPLVAVLYGVEWLPAAPVLQFLMMLTVVRVLTAFALDILMGAGATRWTLWLNLCWAVVLIPALIYGTAHDAIRGAAIAHTVVGLVVAGPVTLFALHRIGVRLAPIVPTLVRPVVAAGVAGAAAFGVVHLAYQHPVLALVLGGTLGAILYVLIAIPAARLRQVLATVRREEAHAVQ